MTGDGNHTSFGGYGLFSGKLERGREVTGGRFNECQIILSATAAIMHTHTPMITVSVPHCPLCSLPCGCKPCAFGGAPVTFPVRKALFACAYGFG